MPVCQVCHATFPCRVEIEGKIRNLGARKYCLICSPFGTNNRRCLEDPQDVPRVVLGELSAEQFSELVQSCSSWTVLYSKIRNGSRDRAEIRARAEEEKVSPSALTKDFPLDQVLVRGSKISRASLKRKLIKANLLVEQCSKCHLGLEWQGEPLTLQLDHINGDNTDNRLENLRLLCPNCHSQTDTYAGRNQPKKVKITFVPTCRDCQAPVSSHLTQRCHSCSAKVTNHRKVENRPSHEMLRQDLEELGSYMAVSRKYGVTGTTIRKWMV
jgi:Zn finger protein HypA/HybF involved in hydrogenase expression